MRARASIAFVTVLLGACIFCAGATASSLHRLPDWLWQPSAGYGDIVYTPLPDETGVNSGYGTYNLRTGAQRSLDDYVAFKATRNPPGQVVTSSYGMVAESFVPETRTGARRITLVARDGSFKLLETFEDPIINCGQWREVLDLDSGGNATILWHVSRPAAKPGQCEADVGKTSLYRLSPAGVRTELWLPDKYKRELYSGQLSVSDDIAVVNPGVLLGRNHVTFLDLHQHRILRDFVPAGTRGSTDVQMSATGSVLISRDIPKTVKPARQIFYLLNWPTSRAKVLPVGAATTGATACGDKVVTRSATNSKSKNPPLNRLRIFGANGRTQFDRRLSKHAHISGVQCSSTHATFYVGAQSENKPSPPGAGSYWITLLAHGR